MLSHKSGTGRTGLRGMAQMPPAKLKGKHLLDFERYLKEEADDNVQKPGCDSRSTLERSWRGARKVGKRFLGEGELCLLDSTRTSTS